ncbi:MAG: hypothetical protein PF692_10545 [Kiritimatiellae bacterium]|jgi:hypothetical protein|nr:hypothetical protein [Kiritimatiellia bacterium]
MKKRYLISVVIVMFFAVLLSDILGLFEQYPSKLFSRKEISKYAQDMVFCSSIESMKAFAIRTDEQKFKNICAEKLDIKSGFTNVEFFVSSMPFYQGGAEKDSNANFYWWFYRLSGDFIIASQSKKDYEITVAFDRKSNVAFFYYDHLTLWGTRFSGSHISRPRRSGKIKAMGYWKRM